MTDELFNLLTETRENRVALISALIMERSAKAINEIADGRSPGYDSTYRPAIENRFNAYQAERIATNLCDLGDGIKRFAEVDCNTGLTPPNQLRAAQKAERFEQIAKLAGFIPTTGGDPRGACAYIADPANPKDGDDMGGRGWGCYR